MGGNKGKSAITNRSNCFHCGESGHWVQDCHLKDVPCTRGCQSVMKLFWSTKQNSYDCRFLKCPNPRCKAFTWVDTCSGNNEADYSSCATTTSTTSSNNVQSASTPTTNNNNIKVTVEEHGKKITFEGQVDVVLDALNKKLNM